MSEDNNAYILDNKSTGDSREIRLTYAIDLIEMLKGKEDMILFMDYKPEGMPVMQVPITASLIREIECPIIGAESYRALCISSALISQPL